MATNPTRSGPVNGPLWGRRAREWAELQEHTARPAFEKVLDRIGVGGGKRYLDVGCGAGLSAQLAAARGANVSGIDAAEALLAIARERTPGADLRHGDLETLPFADHSFDAIAGFNSFQYAAQPARALAEARRVAVPGAPIAILTWGPPEGMQAAAVIGALKPLMPPPPPGAAPGGPFALSNEPALRGLARETGLEPGDILDVDMTWTYPDMATAVRGLNSSGVAARAMDHAGEEAVSRAHEEVLRQFRRPDGTIAFTATFRALIAWA